MQEWCDSCDRQRYFAAGKEVEVVENCFEEKPATILSPVFFGPLQKLWRCVMNEISILQRISQGDRTAVADCLDQYSGLVWSLAKRFCKNQADAEDAAQEVFVEIWKHAERFDPTVASETAFIAMLARRRLIDRYRRAQRRPEISIEPADISSINDDVHARMEICDEASRATRLLNELPVEQANVIELSVYHGLSHSRIAEATGLSLGTVKTNIRRGLSRLRDSLNRSSAKDLSVAKDV